MYFPGEATGGLPKDLRDFRDPSADVNTQDDQNGTALHTAASRGQMDVVRLLLEQGADINAEGGQHEGNALQAAASKGHTDIVRLLVDRGADINSLSGRNETALYTAVLGKHTGIIQYLLNQGADPNIQSGEYGTVLQAAAFIGLREVLQTLIKFGANVNTQGGRYGTALQAAALERRAKIVRLLLDQGADVNAFGGQYGTALHAAAVRGHQDIVQELLKSGADVNARGEESITALQAVLGTYVATVRRVFDNGDDYTTTQYTARLEQFSGIARVLLDKGAVLNTQSGENSAVPQVVIEKEQVIFKSGADIDVQGGQFALRTAAFRGHTEIVRLLLDQGTEVNAQGGQSGGTALQAAASSGHTEIVQLLLDRGADTNAPSGKYGTALYATALHGHIEIVRLLLDHVAEVNAQGGQNEGTALQAAASSGHAEIVQLLLDRGAYTNAPSGEYGTALYAAALHGQIEIVRLLLDRGADVNAKGGPSGGTALQAAASRGHTEIVRLLLDRGADVNAKGGSSGGTALQAAASSGHTEIVRLLLDCGADVNAEGGQYGKTALQAAASIGHLEIVRLLLDCGADVNAEGGQHEGSALQAAASSGHTEIVRLLLDCGAHVNAEGGQYKGTALHAAASSGHTEIVRLLLDNGADVNAQGDPSITALQAAILGDHNDIMEILLESGADPNIQNKKGQTALHIAEIDSIPLLLRYNADVDIRDEDGNPAFDITKRRWDMILAIARFQTPRSRSASLPQNSSRFHSRLQCHDGEHYFDGVHYVCFSSIPAPSILDRIKLSIERIVAAPIDWWPLRQAYVPCPPGHVTMKWMYGPEELYIHLTEDEAMRYRRDCLSISQQTKGQSKQALPRHRQDIVQPASTNDQQDYPSESSAQRHRSTSPPFDNSRGRLGDNSIGSGENINGNSYFSKEIYWCVDKPWCEIRKTLLSVLADSQTLRNDEELYRNLRSEYVKARGRARHYLNWKTCHSVKFVKFQLVRDNHNEVDPGPNEVPTSRPEYDFEMSSPETLMKLAAVNITQGLKNPSWGSSSMTVLPMIPKKIAPPSIQKTFGTEGWGLHAIEGISFFRFILWTIVTQVACFAFVCVWLTIINKTDLQNAFIPSALLNTLITIVAVGCQIAIPS